MLQKLVICNHITTYVADEAEKRYRILLDTVVKNSKTTYFLEFEKSNNRSYELSMKYLSVAVGFNNFTLIVKMMLALFHRQADAELQFSLNDNLLLENMQKQNLIARRVMKS